MVGWPTWKDMVEKEPDVMWNMDEIEKTIKVLRAQATQLNVTADALDAWITPWRNAQHMITEAHKTMQQFMPPWFKP